MAARTAYREARSLYRRGLCEPVLHCAGVPDMAARNLWARPYDRRPLCEQAVALSTRMDPCSAAFLGRHTAQRMVSALRQQFEHDNPRMYEAVNGERVDVGHPCRRYALRNLRSAMRHRRMPLYRFGTAGFSAMTMCERAIRMSLTCDAVVQAWRQAA